MTEGLSKSGSISRGVYFGNGRIFRKFKSHLQLSGGWPDVDILAAIRQLRSVAAIREYAGHTGFDKVFIQLSTNNPARAGDFELSAAGYSEFL